MEASRRRLLLGELALLALILLVCSVPSAFAFASGLMPLAEEQPPAGSASSRAVRLSVEEGEVRREEWRLAVGWGLDDRASAVSLLALHS